MAEIKLVWCGKRNGGSWLRCDWTDLGSTLVCGKPGFGKTTSVAYLVTQAVLQGIRPAIADPHGGEQQSLAAKLAPLAGMYWQPAATTAEASFRLVQRFHAELQRRKERASAYFEKHQQSWSCATDGDLQLLLVVEEVNALLRRFRGIADLLKDLGQEGRKFGLFVILSGQHFTVDALKSSELRSAFVSAIMHRMAPRMASMITDIPESVFAGAPGLNRGECYIRLAGRDSVLAGHVPPIRERKDYVAMGITDRPGDIEEVARVLSDSPPLLRMPAEPVRSEVKVSERTRERLWAERVRLLELVKQPETSFGDAAMIVLGESTRTSGRLRWEAMRVVEEILRTHMNDLEQRAVAV